jgi:transposase
MHHVAIDLGGRESHFCVRSAGGEIVREGKTSTHHLERFFKELPPSVVILETCAEAFKVSDQASQFGHDVRIVPATLAPSLGVGARRTKTDRRDGRALSHASCRMELPSVHVRSTAARNSTSRYRAREALVDSRTKLINTVRGWMRTELLKVASGASATFPKRVREMAQRRDIELPIFIERLLVVCEMLSEQIKAADLELKSLAEQDEVCQRLMTVPGVGPVTAVRFRAVVDDVKRFGHAHAVEAYLGLTPGERSSSLKQRRLGITKAGAPDMRKLLSQAAWSYWRTRHNEPMARWADRIAERRGRAVANVALARKLAGILFAIWRDGTTYDKRRAAAPAHTPRTSLPPRPRPAPVIADLLTRTAG